MFIQRAIDALRAKSGDFKRWIDGGHDVTPTHVRTPCSKCGGQVVCAYADMGATDIYDTFAHVCINPKCDYGETETFFSSSDDGPARDCPFCKALTKK